MKTKLKKLFRSGDPFIWITGSALAVSLVMIVGLIALIMFNGLGFFWPTRIVELTLKDGTKALGQVRSEEDIPEPGVEASKKRLRRTQLQVGNRDLYGQDFRWIDDDQIVSRDHPGQAVLFERREWGNFYGYIKELRQGDQVLARGASAETWNALHPLMKKSAADWSRIRGIEQGDIGRINYEQDQIRLSIKRAQMKGRTQDIPALETRMNELKEVYRLKEEELRKLRDEMARTKIVLVSADGQDKEVPLYAIVRATQTNALGFGGKTAVYFGRLWEFVWGEPRESNTEGGVFPAIFGTVMMVFIMTIAVVPLGILAALYLREYAKQGPLVRLVRIAVNNLAGVPSIVFGVFGLGFFVYFLGGSIDRIFYPESLPTPTYGTGGILWASLTLALLTVPVVIVATEEGLAAVPKDIRNGSLALGATKFETMWRVVVPNAMPGILTGVILAMARAAGEVAPLMITGVVKLAPSLPLDGNVPFIHLERKFMHLGFHIYDVGFQSPNVEAARPMVYATTFLLLVIVVALNLLAIGIRNRLRKKYRTAAF